MEQTPTPEQAPRQSRTVLIVIVLIVIVTVAAVTVMIFANQSQAPTTTQNEQTGTIDSRTDAATITFTNDGFSPTTLKVKKGTKVTIVNSSPSPVQFSSDDHPTHQEDPEINMSELAPGESGSFTVTTVGTHGFHDHNDESKTGTLIVTE